MAENYQLSMARKLRFPLVWWSLPYYCNFPWAKPLQSGKGKPASYCPCYCFPHFLQLQNGKMDRIGYTVIHLCI